MAITRILESVMGGQPCRSTYIVDRASELPRPDTVQRHDRAVTLDTKASLISDGAAWVTLDVAQAAPVTPTPDLPADSEVVP